MNLETLNPATIVLLVLTLTLAPFVAVMITAFTKIVVVLSLLRNALGLQQTPPNVVLNGLAIILAIYVMNPVVLETRDIIYEHSKHWEDDKLTLERITTLADSAQQPLKDFLLRNSSEQERLFFLQSAQRLLPMERRDEVRADDFMIIAPAFTVSELVEAFQIGFIVFLPFLVIDLLVSNLLMALGMSMMSPTLVSLPFKLLLLVFISGWAQLIHGLVLTYA